MDQASKELLRWAMRNLSDGMNDMKEFDFARAYSRFVCAKVRLQQLADEEKLND